tara:strand:- start:5514 stop:5729 length:216 start_codon:yes stop_codon:yes gene_type:complete
MPEDQILRAFGRLEGKVDAVKETVERLDLKDVSQEKRIQNLETSRAWVKGAVAAVAAAWAFIIKLLLGGNG